MIRNNLKAAIRKSGMIAKEVSAKSEVKKRTIDKWVGAEETEPKVIDLYKVCVTLGVTVEEIVDGEKGIAYVEELIAKGGKLWEPPERIKIIVKVLEGLDDSTIKTVEKMVSALK